MNALFQPNQQLYTQVVNIYKRKRVRHFIANIPMPASQTHTHIRKTIIADKYYIYIPITYRLATWSPFPQNLASSSMPSSCMTVESTSKQTASASLQTIFTSSRFAILQSWQRETEERKSLSRRLEIGIAISVKSL